MGRTRILRGLRVGGFSNLGDDLAKQAAACTPASHFPRILAAMGGSSDTLSAAVSGADSRVTVLDDRLDAEEHAAWLWSRAHQLRGISRCRAVIGTEHLSSGWIERTVHFMNATVAQYYLRQFAGIHAAMQTLGTVARSLATTSLRPLSKEEIVESLTNALMNGRAWIIEFPLSSPKSRLVGKTDPSVFAPLNPSLGTNVDFAYIAGLEGDQWLRGYVPFKGKTGIVAGRSGMTIASGFDIGQWSSDELGHMLLPPKVMEQILPYASPNFFRGLTKSQVVEQVGKLGPVPDFTGKKEWADACDAAVFKIWLLRARVDWNKSANSNLPEFTYLPGGWQTVWLSRRYQAQRGPFERLAEAGKWKEAIAALRAEPLYASRTASEANLLEAELPPPLVVPPPKGKT